MSAAAAAAWTAGNTTSVNCNGELVDVTGFSGKRLVQKIRDIAKSAGIAKFDLYDASNSTVESSDVEAGNYEGMLSIVKFNVAA